MKLRPNEKIRAQFLVSATNSIYVSNQVSTLAKTANGAFKVSGATVRSLSLAVPPRPEQEVIAASITNEAKAVDTGINRLEREISLLREYRTRLVADVVTGKLDVRPAARQLLTEPAETETAISVEEDTNEDPEFEPEAADG